MSKKSREEIEDEKEERLAEAEEAQEERSIEIEETKEERESKKKFKKSAKEIEKQIRQEEKIIEGDVSDERTGSKENRVKKDINRLERLRKQKEEAREEELKEIAAFNKEMESSETSREFRKQEKRAKGKYDPAAAKLESKMKSKKLRKEIEDGYKLIEARRLANEAKRLEEEKILQEQNKLAEQQRKENARLEQEEANRLYEERLSVTKEEERIQKEKEQLKNEEVKQISESKSDRQRRLEKDLERLHREELVAEKSKDPLELRNILKEKQEVEEAIELEIKSSKQPKEEPVIVTDGNGNPLNIELSDTEEIGLTNREKNLRKLEKAKKIKEEELVRSRALRNDKLTANLERDKIELERKELKLRKEIRNEARDEARSKKLGKLEAKEEKLRLQKNIVQLRAQRSQNKRIIQQKRLELLQKNLAFAATKGVITRASAYARAQNERETPDSMLIGDSQTGEQREVVIGDSIPKSEEDTQFDIIKSLIGDDFSSKDPVNKKIKLL